MSLTDAPENASQRAGEGELAASPNDDIWEPTAVRSVRKVFKRSPVEPNRPHSEEDRGHRLPNPAPGTNNVFRSSSRAISVHNAFPPKHGSGRSNMRSDGLPATDFLSVTESNSSESYASNASAGVGGDDHGASYKEGLVAAKRGRQRPEARPEGPKLIDNVSNGDLSSSDSHSSKDIRSAKREYRTLPSRSDASPVSTEPALWYHGDPVNEDTRTSAKKPVDLSWILIAMVSICCFLLLTAYVKFLFNASRAEMLETTRTRYSDLNISSRSKMQ